MLSEKRLAKDYGDEVVWYDKKRRWGLDLSFTHYILTKTKLYVRTGFLNIKEESLELYKILDYTLKQPLGQRIFGCGTVTINSRDKSDPLLDVYSVKNARTALRLLEDCVNEERKKYNVYGRDMVGASGVFHDCDNEITED